MSQSMIDVYNSLLKLAQENPEEAENASMEILAAEKKDHPVRGGIANGAGGALAGAGLASGIGIGALGATNARIRAGEDKMRELNTTGDILDNQLNQASRIKDSLSGNDLRSMRFEDRLKTNLKGKLAENEFSTIKELQSMVKAKNIGDAIVAHSLPITIGGALAGSALEVGAYLNHRKKEASETFDDFLKLAQENPEEAEKLAMEVLADDQSNAGNVMGNVALGAAGGAAVGAIGQRKGIQTVNTVNGKIKKNNEFATTNKTNTEALGKQMAGADPGAMPALDTQAQKLESEGKAIGTIDESLKGVRSDELKVIGKGIGKNTAIGAGVGLAAAGVGALINHYRNQNKTAAELFDDFLKFAEETDIAEVEKIASEILSAEE